MPSVVIEMSTLPIADKKRARMRLARAGWTALDCPISGTAVRLKERDEVATLGRKLFDEIAARVPAKIGKKAMAWKELFAFITDDPLVVLGTRGDDPKSFRKRHPGDGCRRERRVSG